MIEQGRQEGFIAADLPDSLIMNMIELFRKDLTSQESLLLAGCSSPQDYGKIAEVLVYGISGKSPYLEMPYGVRCQVIFKTIMEIPISAIKAVKYPVGDCSPE